VRIWGGHVDYHIHCKLCANPPALRPLLGAFWPRFGGFSATMELHFRHACAFESFCGKYNSCNTQISLLGSFSFEGPCPVYVAYCNNNCMINTVAMVCEIHFFGKFAPFLHCASNLGKTFDIIISLPDLFFLAKFNHHHHRFNVRTVRSDVSPCRRECSMLAQISHAEYGLDGPHNFELILRRMPFLT